MHRNVPHPTPTAPVAHPAEEPRITLDAEGRVVSANAAFRAAVGAGSGIAVGAIAPQAWWPTWEAERDRLLRRVAEVVAVEGDPAAVLTLVAEVVATAFGADGGRVARFRDDMAEVVGTWGVGAEVGERFSLRGRRTLAVVAATGRPARVDDYAVLRASDADSARTVDPVYRSGIAAPIRWGGEVWGGLLALSTREDAAFAPGAEDRLAELGELVGMAVAGAAARADERAGAGADPLTGLLDRRAFEERLTVEVERARRRDQEVSLVLFDVDGFGDVNDRLGHAGGDGVLRQVGERLRAAAPAGTAVARVAGDEFAWIVPGLDAECALAAAVGARDTLQAAPFPGAGHLSVSAGVCDLRHAPDGPRDLQRKTHVALYAAQHSHREGVARFTPEITELVSSHEQSRRMARARALSGIRLLARAVDARDPSTQRHSERVAALAHELGLALGWPREEALLLHQAGFVHDVGKIGVPDSVLLKPGPLTDEERRRVQEHAALGAEIVAEALGPEQVEWVRHHHERPDGTGYPDGVGGGQLSVGARILALADAFDAMTSMRGYRSALDVEAAVWECRRGSGTQFCPRVVRALERLWEAGRLPVAPLDPLAQTGRSAAADGAA
ncbi:MAG: diguanylate cyclase [Thermoleophilia bacterium]